MNKLLKLAASIIQETSKRIPVPNVRRGFAIIINNTKIYQV